MQMKVLQKELADPQKLLECAQRFGLVGDLTRLKICYLLCRYPNVSVSEIAILVGRSVSAVSHSLAKLRHLGLVKTDRQAKEIHYRLTDPILTKMVETSVRL